MATTKRYRYHVNGRGLFPLDMLRYDACWPARQDDVVAMTAPGNPERGVRIESEKAPTIGRWRSFGWTVTDVVEHS